MFRCFLYSVMFFTDVLLLNVNISIYYIVDAAEPFGHLQQ